MIVSTEKKVAPLLRFIQFTENWKVRKFGDLYSFHPTNSLSRDKLNYEEGDVKNIHYGDIHTKFQPQFYLNKELVPFINNEVDLLKTKEDSFCKNGDLVMADASEDYSDIGKTIELIDLNCEKVLAGLHTFLARPTSIETQIGFTGFLLKSWKLKKQIMTIAQGTKVLSLSTGRVSNLQLNIPSLSEQQKIASFLTAIDTKLQQLSKKKNLLEHYKKGVMHQIFKQEIRFKKDDGGSYPDWVENKLGEIGIFKSGIGFTTSEQGGRIGIAFYKVSDMNLKGNEFEMTFSNNYVNTEQIKKLKYIVIKEKAIIFAKVGAAIFLERKRIASNFLLDNNMMAYVPNGDILFFKYQLEIIRLSKFAQVGALPSYNSSDLKTIKIKLPCSIEQQKIATFLRGIDKKIELVKIQLEQTQNFKKGLLQQMFV